MCKYEQIFTFWLCVSVCCKSTSKHHYNGFTKCEILWVFQDFKFHLIKQNQNNNNNQKFF